MDSLGNSRPGLGFSSRHASAIAISLAVLAFFAFMKNDYKLPDWKFLKSSGSNIAEKKLTYEEARDKVAAQYGTVNNENGSLGDQLATIDSSFAGGSVLGASTEQLLPGVDYFMTPEILAALKVKVGAAATQTSVDRYFHEVRLTESHHDNLTIIASLNSSDPHILNESKKATGELIYTLSTISVPKELEHYHKSKIIYYLMLSKMADIFANGGNDPLLSDLSTGFLSLSQDLDSQYATLAKTYQLE